MLGERKLDFKLAIIKDYDNYGNPIYEYSEPKQFSCIVDNITVAGEGTTEFMVEYKQRVHLQTFDIHKNNFDKCLVKIDDDWFKNESGVVKVYDSPLRFGGYFTVEKVGE